MSRLAVLTAKPELAVYRELEAAAVTSGHELRVLDALRLVAQSSPALVWRNGSAIDVRAFASVLPRVGNWRPDSVLAVLGAFEAAGTLSLNGGAAIVRGRDHWLTAGALAGAGIPHPPTVAGAEPEALAATASGVCGFPCVVKQRRSRQGVGVIRCAGRAELEAVLDSLWRLGDEVVVQRFCGEGGVSRRVLVLQGEALGATEHRAAPGEFRSNAARGGSVEAVELEPALVDLAKRAAAALGLGFAGVDLFPDRDGWLVGEVNPSPGWRHFAAATGIGVAARLVGALAACGGAR